MIRFIIFSFSLAALCFSGYWLGKREAETEAMERQVQEVKYESQKKAKIWVRPNDSRDLLLERMRKGIL